MNINLAYVTFQSRKRMKVGDIVRQGERIMKMKGRAPSKALGVIVEINELGFPTKLKGWEKFLGRSVTVLWETGRLTENVAENSLEKVSDKESQSLVTTYLGRL